MKLIKLSDRFYLDSDDKNIIVLESKIYSEGKRAGEEYKDVLAYCGTAKSAIDYIYNKLTKEKIGSKDVIQTFAEYQKSIEKVQKEVEKMLNKAGGK